MADAIGAYPVILDPAVGGGALIKPMRTKGLCQHVIGLDINPEAEGFRFCNESDVCDYTKLDNWSFKKPNAVIMNAPFNGAGGGQLYPHLFLKKTFELFGPDIPVVMVTSAGFRNNVRSPHKERWTFLSEHAHRITSVMTLLATTFTKKDDSNKDVQVPAEILFFNMPHLPPHMIADYSAFEKFAQRKRSTKKLSKDFQQAA